MKKIKYILFFGIILWSLNQELVYGQNHTYNLEWGTYNDNNNGTGATYVSNASTADADGNLYLGYAFSNTGELSGGIDKFSSLGQLLWRVELYEQNTFIYIDDLKIDHNQDLIICGWTNATGIFGTPGAWQEENAGLHDRFLAKLDSHTGEIIWSTYFGGPANDEDGEGDLHWEYNSLVAITDSNDIVWTTNMRSEDMGTPGVFQEERAGDKVDYVISKFDTQGQRIWTTYYGYNHSIITGLQVDTGGIYVAGMTRSGADYLEPYFDTSGTWTVSPYDSKAYISKFDHTGNRLWSFYFGGEGSEYLIKNSLAQTASHLYLVGHTSSNTGITSEGTYMPEMNNFSAAGFLVQFDKAGTYQWGTYFADALIPILYVEEDTNKIYVSGNTSIGEGVTTPGAYQENLMGPSDAYALEFDASGQRVFGTYYGGEKKEDGPHVMLTPSSKGFYLIGLTNSLTGIATPGAYQDTFLGDPDSPSANYSFIAHFVEENLSVSTTETTDFVLYPNPVKDYLNIKNAGNAEYEVRIFNMTGQQLLDGKFISSSAPLDLSALPAGMYIARIKASNESIVYKMKVVKL